MNYWYVDKFKKEIIKREIPPSVKKENIKVDRKSGIVFFKKEETVIENGCFGTEYYKEIVDVRGYIKKKYAQEELNSIINKNIEWHKMEIRKLQDKIK